MDNKSLREFIGGVLDSTDENILATLKSLGYNSLFGYDSNDLNYLNPEFISVANHIISFISYWCKSNTGYNYEIVSTSRSWFTQRIITNDTSDFSNGLSWYQYGSAISINVFKKVSDTFYNNDNTGSINKTISNTESKRFIEDAQKWFITNTLNNRVLLIDGVYQRFNLEHNPINIVYWGGLFSTYSNETHWEYHPNYVPSDITRKREEFLNAVRFNGSLFVEFETKNTFLDTIREMTEEDYISFYRLKCKINGEKKFSFYELVDWKTNNPNSYVQTIDYLNLIGDDKTKALFENISSDISETNIGDGYTINNFTFNTDEDGGFNVSLTYDNSTYYFNTGEMFEIPLDIMLTEDEIEEHSPETIMQNNSNQLEESINNASNEIDHVSSKYSSKFEYNEHGPISQLSSDFDRVLSISDVVAEVKNNLPSFEEMVTPPNQNTYNKSYRKTKMFDLTYYLKRNELASGDEMISPDMLN